MSSYQRHLLKHSSTRPSHKDTVLKFLQTVILGSTNDDANFKDSLDALTVLHHFVRSQADHGDTFTSHTPTVNIFNTVGISFQTALFTNGKKDDPSKAAIPIPSSIDHSGTLQSAVGKSATHRFTLDNIVEYFDAEANRVL